MTKFTVKKSPKAPKHLQASTKRWWNQVVADFDLEEHHLRLLTLAAESWDRAQSAREAIAEHGMFFTTKSGEPRRHPAVQVEHDAKISFARLLRELALDVAAPDDSRPPQIRR
jgi:P27 family predicted phage terminase small subunit